MSLSTTPTNALTFEVRGALDLAGAEIAAFDPGTDRLFVTSSDGLQIIDLSDPTDPILIETIDFTDAAYGYDTTDLSSVAISNGVVAVALPADPKQDDGQVIFLDAATLEVLGDATVGSLPDNVVFTPDGTKLLVANEGEYLDDNGGPSPAEGSVSIIDLSGGFGAPLPVATADFTAFDGQEDALRAQGVRIFLGQSVSTDVEPEYIAVNAAGTLAMVTLQENNAVALLDIATATITEIVPLGQKDFSTLLVDFSDRDGPGGSTAIKLETGNPVFGLYMPDAIDSYEFEGETYYVMANEGDDRNDFITPDEVIRLKDAVNLPDYVLAPDVFPDVASLLPDAELGRLNVVVTPGMRGDIDGDGEIEQILTLGGRSFSILDSDGNRVFDSADIIERIVAEFGLVANNTSPGFDDTRSDNKGPEPEGIEIAVIGDSTFAFVGLERSHMTLVFDVTDPNDVTYTGAALRDGDLNPEGLLYISAEDSPTGEALLVTSNEESNNISVFGVNETFTLQILHASDWEGGVEATTRAPNFAAIVDALEDDFVNSITLLSGDNFIPGPFTAAGTDLSIRDELAAFYEQLFGLPDGSLTAIRTASSLPFNAVDIAIANAMGVQASVLGNHEFDLGTNALTAAINSGVSGSNATNIGALFPYLSANVLPGTSELAGVFTPTLLPATDFGYRASDFDPATGLVTNPAGASRPQFAPWTTIEENGEIIGVLGITTQVLAAITALGNASVADPFGDGGVDNMAELAFILQPLIDQMKALDIDKIILLSHLQQIDNERELATLLNGVDIILGGGSNTIFANPGNELEPGDVPGGTYPEFYTSAPDANGDTHQVALINTDGNYHYVGRLAITFDANGEIIPDSVDPTVSGPYVTTDAGVDAVAGNGDGVLDDDEREAIFADGTRAGEVKQLTDAVADVIQAKDGNVFGFTDVFLEGRRNFVRTQETNLGNLTADTNLAVAKAFDLTTVISIKNGGGIRAEIGAIDPATGIGSPPAENPDAGKPEGGVSQLDIENSLRFNNGLSLATLTAQGIKNLLENAVRDFAPGATPGQFPQISGIKFSFDPTRARLDRVIDVAVVDQQGNVIEVIAEDGTVVGDAMREFRIVTLNFLLPDSATDPDGGDGLMSKGAVVNDTAPGAVVGTTTLATFTDFADLDRVDLFNAAVDGTGFAAAGREQSALADFFAAIHGTPETAFDVAETPASLDERTQNLSQRTGDVIDTPVAGAGEDDLIVGTSGANTIASGAGEDSVFGAGGDDSLSGGSDGDALDGGDGNDSLRGNGGNDTLVGGEGDDRLFGQNGDDVLVGGAGNNVFIGGAGSDIFVLSAAAGTDRVRDFETGIDQIDVSDFGFASFADVIAQMADNVAGNIRFEADADTVVILFDVTVAQLQESDFILV
jgi:2',3'-cyclic-nucleotide 2'-phosphodiesterase (5'-nucleotidase family)